MNPIAIKFQEILRRSLPSVTVETINDRRLNLTPKTKGVYLGLRSSNRIELEDAQKFMSLIGAGFMTVLEGDRGQRMIVYFVSIKECHESINA